MEMQFDRKTIKDGRKIDEWSYGYENKENKLMSMGKIEGWDLTGLGLKERISQKL